ncbi:MAG: hypothetical protein GF329_07750 [Candidatus Lokiarchaeota archaeon]|nr:hypothetical protein [Candidatus Lokiarchaeota archaeon]
MAGSTSSYGAVKRDSALVKFYPSGAKAWNVTWGGSEWDRGLGIALDSVGNIYVTGETESYGAGVSDIVVVKFYPNGTVIWNVSWGDSNYEYGYDIALDAEGNVYVTGSTSSYGEGLSNIAVVKFYPNGTKAWNFTWDTSSYNIGYGIALDLAGNIYVTGEVIGYGGVSGDLVVVKFYEKSSTTPPVPGFLAISVIIGL